jgi:hypothetical protein
MHKTGICILYATVCEVWSIFMPMICSVQLFANRDAKAAAEEVSLQIVKILII